MRMPIATANSSSLGGERGRPAVRSPPPSSLALLLLGLGADLLEQCHRVEVVPTRLDLRALEDVDDDGGRFLALARRRDGSYGGCQRAGVGALPGHFQHRGFAAGDGGRDRSGGIRESRLPALEQLDELVQAFDGTLCPELVVARVGGEQSTHLLPVAAVKGVNLLVGDLDQFLSGQRFGLQYGHSVAPSVRSDARTGSTRIAVGLRKRLPQLG